MRAYGPLHSQYPDVVMGPNGENTAMEEEDDDDDDDEGRDDNVRE